MAQQTANFGQMKDYMEGICNIRTGDSFIDSTIQTQYINKGYEKAAYRYDWPQMLKRDADVIVENVDRYTLPSDFRKFKFLVSRGTEYKFVEFDYLPLESRGYAVDYDSDEYILNNRTLTASTAYTLQNSETAGSTVVVELDTVSGLAASDEIWIDDSTDSEFTVIQSVDTSATTITIKMANNHNSSVILYKRNEVNYFQYQREITVLSGDSDTTTLPNNTDLIIPHYAAYLYFRDNEMPQKADMHLGIFQDELTEAWLAFDKSASGESNQFSV